jgi:hypothetical protein
MPTLTSGEGLWDPASLDRARGMVEAYRDIDDLDRRIRNDRVEAVQRSVAKVERLWDQVYGE